MTSFLKAATKDGSMGSPPLWAGSYGSWAMRSVMHITGCDHWIAEGAREGGFESVGLHQPCAWSKSGSYPRNVAFHRSSARNLPREVLPCFATSVEWTPETRHRSAFSVVAGVLGQFRHPQPEPQPQHLPGILSHNCRQKNPEEIWRSGFCCLSCSWGFGASLLASGNSSNSPPQANSSRSPMPPSR